MIRRLGIVAVALAAIGGRRAEAGCPSFTKSSSANDKHCDVEAAEGVNPSETQWAAIFEQVAQGPRRWKDLGPPVADLTAGCAEPRRVPAQFPCEIVRAIAYKESAWRQFCKPTWPADQRGRSSRTIIAFDCGYGVSQVTSGMRAGETAPFNRKKVANNALYNMASGASILARKWHGTPCVGDRDPEIIENWYIALWAYNGLSYANNPANPIYDSARGVYNPSVGGAYPYQEKIFGIIENPPRKVKRIQQRGIPLAYPRLEEMPRPGKKVRLSQPACASPTDCANRREVTRTACPAFTEAPAAPDAGTPAIDAGGAPDARAATADAAVARATPDAREGAGTKPDRCGCHAGGGGEPPLVVVLAAVLFGLLRRRRG